MTIDDSIKLIEAMSKLIGTLMWPVLIMFAIVRLGPWLKNFLENMTEFSFKGVGIEASAKSKSIAIKVASALGAASAIFESTQAITPNSAAREAKNIASVVETEVTPHTIDLASKATVLWVDDNPDNNLHEHKAFEALGIKLVLAKSTDEALNKAKHQAFSAIISDMGRPTDPRAGYTLLEQLRNNGNNTPFVIYAGANTPEYQAEAQKRGALGSTNRASELFKYVLSAIKQA